ncbi:hypothetical protein KIPB_015226, partial [Kipferlia bialata]
WKPTSMVLNTETDKWVLRCPLPSGTHQYKYMVDGQWVVSADFPTETDADGNTNNVLVVHPFVPRSKSPPKQCHKGMGCQKQDCHFTHPEGWDPKHPKKGSPGKAGKAGKATPRGPRSSGPYRLALPHALMAVNQNKPCPDKDKCRDPNCPYTHPSAAAAKLDIPEKIKELGLPKDVFG